MNSWFCKKLGDGMFAAEPLERLESMFHAEYADSVCPADVALFYRHESDGSLHCSVNVYFSPAAVEMADLAGARPCETPSVYGLSLLVGSEEALSLLKDG